MSPNDPGPGAGLHPEADLGRDDLLQEIQDLAEVGHWRHDLEIDEVTASPRWYELWGLDPGGDEGRPFPRLLEMVHPDDRPIVEDAKETAVRKQRKVSCTIRIRRPDGEEAWIASRLLPEVEDDEVVALRGIHQDVTERKEAELELERKNRRLQEAQRVARVGSWRWDVASDSIAWSREAARMFGVDADELPEPSLEALLEFIHPDDRDRVKEVARLALETGTFETHRFRVPHDRGVRWLEGRGEVDEEDGEVVAVRGTVLDVTDHRDLTESLRRKRRRIEGAQNAAQLGFVEATRGPEPDRWSDTLYTLLGVEPGDVEPSLEGYLELVHPEDRERVAEAGQAALDGVDGDEISYRIVRPDGEIRHIWTRFRQGERGPAGEPVVYVTIQDVTERAKLRKKLQRERRRLQEAQRVAKVGSWECDAASGTLTLSDEHYRLLGLDPEEVDPGEEDLETFLEAVHPDDRGAVRGHLEEALGTGEYPTFEWRTNPDRGEVRWIESRGEVVVEDGEVAAIRGTALDATERRRLLDRLKEVHRIADLGFVEARPGPEPDDWSDEVYRILGREPGEIEPTLEAYLECVHPEDRERVAEAGQAALDGREGPCRITYRVQRPDGEVRHVDTGFRAFEEVADESRAVYVTIQDVTDRVRLEEELREARGEAVEAN